MMLLYLTSASKLKKSHISDLRNARRLTDFFKGYRCDTWTIADRKEYIAVRLSTGVTNATVNRELSLLSIATKYANSEFGWKIDNICTGGRLREDTPPFRWFTEIEAGELIEFSKVSDAESLHDYVVLSLNTGMRCHEILYQMIKGVDLEVGLTWDRVDLSRDIIYLHPEHQKSGKAGSVVLNKAAKAALISRWEFRRKHCPTADYVFVNANGEPIQDMKKSFKTALKRAGIKPCGVHSMRHTFATRLIQKHVPIERVKEVMRHAKISTTLKYIHFEPSQLRKAVAALDDSKSHYGHSLTSEVEKGSKTNA